MSDLQNIRHRRVFLVALCLGVGLIYLAFLKPGIWGIDGNDMLNVAKSLVTKGNFTVPPGEGVQGPDGRYYSIRYPLLPMLATPLVALGLFLGDTLNIPTRYTSAVCALVLNVIFTAITTSLVALIALRLGAKPKNAYLSAISYAFGSTALVYAHQFFAEPLLSLLTSLSVYFALGKGFREHTGASFLGGIAIIAKPAGIVIGPVLATYFFLKKYPIKVVITPLIGTGMGLMLYLGYNYIRFGSFFSSGQNSSRFQIAGMPERFLGMLFSPGAGGGLIWYCPAVFLAILGLRHLWKTKPQETLLIVGMFGSYLVLHAFWEFGGWNWGPRFLVPVLPILFASIAILGQRWWRWLLILTAMGFLVNCPTLVCYYQRYYAEAADAGHLKKALSLWAPFWDTPLFNVWGAASRQLQEAFNTNVEELLKGVGEPPGKGKLATSDLLRIVAVWWWMLPAAGISVWWGFLVAMSMILVGTWLLYDGWRILSDTAKSDSLVSQS